GAGPPPPPAKPGLANLHSTQCTETAGAGRRALHRLRWRKGGDWRSAGATPPRIPGGTPARALAVGARSGRPPAPAPPRPPGAFPPASRVQLPQPGQHLLDRPADDLAG